MIRTYEYERHTYMLHAQIYRARSAQLCINFREFVKVLLPNYLTEIEELASSRTIETTVGDIKYFGE